jgi:hypothetical protein
MTAVRFTRRGDRHAVTLTYDPAVIEIIKTIPAFARSWNPRRREWLILELAYAIELAGTLRDLGHTVIGMSSVLAPEHVDTAHWARALFQRVGAARAPLAYKLLSRVCHPDAGGDHQLQLELNAAYAELPDTRKEAS